MSFISQMYFRFFCFIWKRWWNLHDAFFLGEFPEHFDEIVGESVEIDVEFAFCRGIAVSDSGILCKHIKLNNSRSTSFLVYESGDLWSYTI